MPQSPTDENVREIKQSGTKWKYRGIPTRRLGIGTTHEAQELFDSGYIGDAGIGNRDLELHVYSGNLLINTDETYGKDIRIIAHEDNIFESSRHTEIKSKGNLSITSDIDATVSITGNRNETVNGSVNEKIKGVDGYSLHIDTNLTENIVNNHKSTVGQNYTSTVGLDAQYNSRNSTHNTSGNFTIMSEEGANLTAKNTMDISGTNQVRINSTNDTLIQSKNLGLTITESINQSCRDLILRVSNDYNSQINGNWVVSVAKNTTHNSTGTYTNTSAGLTLKSANTVITTEEANGNIALTFGTGKLSMNASEFTTPTNNMLKVSTEFEAVKVWKAVYN